MKVHLISDSDWWYQPLRKDEFTSAVMQHGIEWAYFDQWNEECDLVISHPYLVPEQYKGPLIVFENWECCRLMRPSRLLLQSHNVLKIIKVMSYSVVDLHNAPNVQQRVMGQHYERGDIRIGDAEFSKIEVVTTAAYEQCSWWPVKHLEKDVDVSMCVRGRAAYERLPHYEHHRRLACRAMLELPLDVTQVLYYGVGHAATYFDGKDAHAVLQRSKAGISPYGVSEMSIRDYQVVLACASLVKPHCFITLDPDPFAGNCVWCAESYCNLADAVAQAIEEFDLGERVQKANALMASAGMENLAYRMAGIIKGTA